MFEFICYPKCSTCQKAQKWLDANHIPYQIRNIKTENPSAAELSVWQAASGLSPRKFFNTSGLKYNELHLKDKLPEMEEAEQIALLASDGMLVKRPLLINLDGSTPTLLIGFREAEWQRLL